MGAGIEGAAGSAGGAAATAPPAWPDLSLGRLYRNLPSHGAPALRVGIIVDEAHTTRFARALLDDLCSCAYVTPVLVLQAPRAGTEPGGLLRRAPRAFRLYQRLVQRKQRLAPDPLAVASRGDLLAGLPVLRCELRDDRRLVAGAPAPSALQAARLDLIVNLTAWVPADEIVGATRQGVWYYRVGGEALGSTPVPGLGEFIARDPVTTAELRAQLPGGGEELILRQLHTATMIYLLPDANGSAPVWSAQHLMIATLHRLHAQGWPALRQESTSAAAAPPRSPPAGAQTPGNLRLLAWLASLVLARTWRRLRGRSQRSPVWSLAVRRAAQPLYERAATQDLRAFRWIENPAGHFLADPFLFQDGADTWLFFEDLSLATGRGTLCCARLGADGQLHDRATCLERPYHLSYPQVFRTAEGIFMIPETADAGVVELYRATAFPYRWEWTAKLLELRAVDSTVVRAAGRWWMFTSPMTVPANAPTTLLFAADELRGPWRLQDRCNVAADARTARGGGAIVDTGAALIRPSQDCTLEYGRRLLFNRLAPLAAEGFGEQAALVIEPGWLPGMVGIHSYARAGEWEAIDGLFESGMSPA